MSIFGKSFLSILSEACESDEFECDDLYEDSIMDELDDELENIEDYVDDDELEYTEEMVTVIESSDQTKYFIEMDNMIKYMNSQNVLDISEAINNICEANNIDSSKVCLVIESDEDFEEVIDEVKSSKKNSSAKSKKLGYARGAVEFLKSAKNKGISIAKKKKSKKKKKK